VTPAFAASIRSAVLTAIAACIASNACAAAVNVDTKRHDAALEILTKSIAYRTVVGAGQVPAYAEYLKGVLVDAGYAASDIKIEAIGESATLVARYPGTDSKLKPMLLIGHMDVVEAKRDDWERDPFVPVVEKGYVYGRGSVDNKFDVAMTVATLAQLKKSGWKPRREVILALSGDEETSMTTTRKLAAQFKGVAEFALNGDAGGGLLSEEGKPVFYGIQAGEKTYADYTLTVTNPGGHSSRPGKTNAIVQLARALVRVGEYQFPVMTNELTQAYFKASAPNTPGPAGEAMKRYVANPKDEAAIAALSAEPEYVGQLRTTCVPSMLSGGHAPNALPQRATANVNCRIFPGTSIASVAATLAQVIRDPGVAITAQNNGSIEGVTSPLRDDVMSAVKKSINAQHKGLSIVPSMSAGATDGMHFRANGVPTYGVAGLFMKASDDFSHGLNERAPVAAIDGALAHWDSVLRDLAR
jgi:acetylornithine deacetylase/succinyl-diaminopimelate desuccinylase-like protein